MDGSLPAIGPVTGMDGGEGRWFESIRGHVKMYWCSKCAEGIAKTARQQRPGSKGWVCPACSTGLPRMPMSIIEEETPRAEILIKAVASDLPRKH